MENEISFFIICGAHKLTICNGILGRVDIIFGLLLFCEKFADEKAINCVVLSRSHVVFFYARSKSVCVGSSSVEFSFLVGLK